MIKNVSLAVIENIGTCNLHCKYCFPEQMWDREGRGGKMQESKYRNILDIICRNNEKDVIGIRFAGGEPLLAGLEWFKMAFQVGNEISKKYKKTFKYSLQTNATLLTPALLSILKENKVQVGVSIDGPQTINDLTRGQTNSVIKGISSFSDYFGYNPGIIVVVSRLNVERMHEVVNFLYELRIPAFRANLMGADTYGNVQLMPTSNQWLSCQQTICNEIVNHNGKIMEFNVCQKALKFVNCLLKNDSPFTDSQDSCANAICGAGQRLLYFDRDGNSYPCPRSVVNQANRFGNYHSDNFEQQYDIMLENLPHEMKLRNDCINCPAQIACDFGCHAWNNGRYFQIVCNSSKELFLWFKSNLDVVAKIYYYTKRRQELEKLGRLEEMKEGVELPETEIQRLIIQLEESLRLHCSRQEILQEVINKRYSE